MPDTSAPIATDPVKQFSVFIENRVGRLHDLVALLAKHNVHIMAMTTIDQTDTALDRMVVDDPDRARTLMKEHNFFFTECEIVAVEFTDESQLAAVLSAMLTVEVNIHYAYSFLMRPQGKSALALSVEDNDLATCALNQRGFKVLTQHDISR
ncbi:acetolactate synthase [Oleiharenicola lentus]|uniref:acetolactate synthase n=1 Tax=Oleiharenicola lentus TaxID=2508720 RepID=UPI003F671619